MSNLVVDPLLGWITDETNQIITRSAVRSTTKTSSNLRLDPIQGEDQPQDLTSGVFVYGRSHPDGSKVLPNKSSKLIVDTGGMSSDPSG